MAKFYHPVSTGPLTIPGNLFLAPVAGFSDAAFRGVCLKHGASLAFTEMVSCEGIVRGNKKTVDLLIPADSEESPAVQLFCSNPETAASAVSGVLPFFPALIDLNCGCPVPKVVKTGAGSALMKDPSRIGEIIAALREALDENGRRDIPVTVKLRSGWSPDSITFLEAAEAAVEAGAAMITLHPRTRSQGYSGASDWSLITRLKQSVAVPVIGSGDLFSPEAARRMLSETRCDGIMFARGAIGNPFIFSRTRHLLETGDPAPPPAAALLAQTMREHLDMTVRLKGESAACREMRKHFCAYTKGLQGGAALRQQASRASTVEEYHEILRLLS